MWRVFTNCLKELSLSLPRKILPATFEAKTPMGHQMKCECPAWGNNFVLIWLNSKLIVYGVRSVPIFLVQASDFD